MDQRSDYLRRSESLDGSRLPTAWHQSAESASGGRRDSLGGRILRLAEVAAALHLGQTILDNGRSAGEGGGR